jgi:hypothetical protein
MKWQFELSDCPTNSTYPILAHQVLDNGVKRGSFYLTIDHLVEALQKKPDNLLDADALRGEENSTPPLPFGTIRYSSNETQTRERITLEIPQKQWEIRYGIGEKDDFYSIGFPRMVVQYLVINNINGDKTIKEMRIYAVENNRKPIDDDTPLFIFPYPNVGKTNGIVCWGNNARLEIKSLVELEKSFLWFVSAPFNEDHGVRTTLGIPRFKELLEVIQDKPFDDEWLVPSKTVFRDLFKNN